MQLSSTPLPNGMRSSAAVVMPRQSCWEGVPGCLMLYVGCGLEWLSLSPESPVPNQSTAYMRNVRERPSKFLHGSGVYTGIMSKVESYM
jgi:hypothetical protein